MKAIYKNSIIYLAFIFATTLSINAQNITKEYKVSSFSEVDVHSVGNIYFIQGNSESVKIECNKNVEDYVVVENIGKQLQVYTKNVRNWKGKLDIYITFRNLTGIAIRAAGNVKSNNTINTKDLDVRCKAAGNISLDVQSNSLTSDLTAVGNIRFSGNAGTASFNCTGTGNINTEGLHANNLFLNLKGVGNVIAFASKEISIDASGTGNITYKGKPTVKQLIKHGTGHIKGE